MNALTAKIATLNVEMLKEMAIALNDDFRDGTDILLNAVMAQLETMMPEAEFVAMCEAM